MENKLKVLILEDLPSDAELAQRELRVVLKNDPTVKVVDTEDGFVKALKVFKPDLIISDYRLPTFDGLSALKIRQDISPYTPFVMLTGSVNEEIAVECMKAGADDYVIKEHIKRLGPAVLNSLEKKKNEQERRWAKKELISSEERLKILFESAPDAYYMSDLKGTFLDGNKAAEDLMGYKKEELIGKNFLKLKLLPAKQLLKASNLLMKNIQGHGTGPDEFIINNKNGLSIPVEIRTYPVNIRGNTVVLGIARDITERLNAEREVRKLSIAIEQSPVSITITDAKGSIEYVNPTFEKFTGYTIDEAIGLNPSILKSGITPDSEYKKLWETITKGKVWTGEFLNKKKNGELYWVSATISPVKDQNDKITHYLAVKEDISDSKELINDLMEREEKYRTLTQNLNVGVFRSNPGKNGKIIEANHALLKIFGLKNKKDLEYWNAEMFYPDPMEREKFEEELLSKGFLINKEMKLRKKDGTLFFVSMSTTIAKDESGKVIHYDGIIEDITKQKMAQAEKEKHQKYLETLSNELTLEQEKTKRNLAIALHDKLGQYLALANFKTNELSKSTTDSKHKKIIGEITTFIEDAIKESRDITYELSPAVLYEMGLIPAISLKLDDIEQDIKIKTSLIDQSKSFVLEENVQIIIFRTISELLQNVKIHSQAKKLIVSFRLLTDVYRITVSDTGTGFDMDTMRERAVSEKKFGLFSIIERIKYIGGEVKIDSIPKKGTKVVIDIPIKN